jgi:hypothetical protein
MVYAAEHGITLPRVVVARVFHVVDLVADFRVFVAKN